jgi:hypothetical protein
MADDTERCGSGPCSIRRQGVLGNGWFADYTLFLEAFMKSTRRQMIQAAASGFAALGSAGPGRGQSQENGAKKKRVLAILGDAYHCVAPLDATLVAPLRKEGYEAVVIMDYAVPFDDFRSYDLIIMSREGHEYVKFFRDRDTNAATVSGRPLWITPAQEQKFEDYVKAGGRLFLYHDGFGFYPKDGGVSRVAKAFFIRHPASVNIEISPTSKMPELTRGVTPFNVIDEEYEVEMDESQTSVFMESRSPEHGRRAQGWAHSYGQGKVAVFIPGHSAPVSSHPMVRLTVQNILEWLKK